VTVAPAALEVIGRTPRVLAALLDGLPDEVVLAPNAEGWSLKDIVAHLHDAESIAFVERITRLLDEDRPFIQSIDPPARLVVGGYFSRALSDLLGDLQRLRAEHVAWLGSLSSAQLERAGEHDTVGEIRVIDIAHQWAAHDMAHLRQMGRMLQEYFAPLMGNTRGFYDV
jgi:hypothetical protein